MEFSEQAMIDAWVDVSVDRLARVRGNGGGAGVPASSVRIDAVRADTHAPVVTIVNWRSQRSPRRGARAASAQVPGPVRQALPAH